MTFLQVHYYSLETDKRREIADQVVNNCEVSKRTFYNWINKKQAPKLAQELISKLTGIDKQKLYKPINLIN